MLLVEDIPMSAISAPPRSLNSVILCSKQRTRISALDQSPSILISPCCSRMRGTPLCTVAWSMPHVQALQIYELGRKR